MDYFAGLDVSVKDTSVCVIDEAGKIIREVKVAGNRQYITLGNASANDRVSLFLMDYPGRRRLKIYARIEAKELAANPALTEEVVPAGYRGKPQRLFLLHPEVFDSNCSQHIRPRFTEGDIHTALGPSAPGSRRSRPRIRCCGKNSRARKSPIRENKMQNASRPSLPPFSLEKSRALL